MEQVKKEEEVKEETVDLCNLTDEHKKEVRAWMDEYLAFQEQELKILKQQQELEELRKTAVSEKQKVVIKMSKYLPTADSSFILKRVEGFFTIKRLSYQNLRIEQLTAIELCEID